MKKKIVLLAMVFASIGLVSSVSANILENPGFEQGDLGQLDTIILPGWTSFGYSGEHVDTAGYTIGDYSIKMWWDVTGIYQDFSCVGGMDYDISINAITEDGDHLQGWDAVFKVEWYDSGDFLIEVIEIGRFIGEKDDKAISGDPVDVWKLISATKTAPGPAAYGRVVMYLEQADNWESTTGGVIYWDNVSVNFPYAATNPSPEHHAYHLNPDLVTSLSWDRPAPRQSGDTILCDVLFGTDPNMVVDTTKILDKQDADSVALGSLNSNEDYYWRVDCYDPDGSGPEIKTESCVWTFNTANWAPAVDAGDKQAVWLVSGSATVSLDAFTDDDGQPDSPGELTLSWTVDSGPATPTFTPNNSVEDPDVTFTVAGDYILRLTADDGLDDTNDVVKIRVYSESYTGLIAHWKLDETSGPTAVDSVGGHNGTLAGDPVWQSAGGQVNGAVDLDGDGDYVDCGGGKNPGDPNGWADLTDEITISAWMKGTFDKAWQSIVTKGDTSWRITRDCHEGDSNNVMFGCNNVGQIYSGSTGDVGDDEWHHVVGTFDGVYMKLYVDGILASTNKVTEGATIAFNDYDVRIGSDAEFDGEHEFNGLLDEVRIYEIGITAEMVLDLFIAEGGSNSCGLTYFAGDINEDCHVDLADFAEIAENWLECNDVSDPRCN